MTNQQRSGFKMHSATLRTFVGRKNRFDGRNLSVCASPTLLHNRPRFWALLNIGKEPQLAVAIQDCGGKFGRCALTIFLAQCFRYTRMTEVA